MDVIDIKLDMLSKSKFRNSFKLRNNDIKYINDKGMAKIRGHAYDFVNKRLSSKDILNDGKQTPLRGHPVFVAQYATGTCCRRCLYKWHKIEINRELNNIEIDYIVNIIMEWIVREMNK